MAIKSINIGQIANDGTGDDIRTAFNKINDNFQFLQDNLGLDNTALNIGTNGEGLFKQKVDGVLQFKKIEAGFGITLDGSGDTVVVNSTSAGVLTISDGTTTDDVQIGANNLQILGGTNITTTVTDNTVTISSSASSIFDDPAPKLGSNLNLNSNDITGTGNIDIDGSVTANAFIGNLTGNVVGNLTGLTNGLDIRDIESELTSFDFGTMTGQYTRVIPYLLSLTPIDMGTFNTPSGTAIDGRPEGELDFPADI